MLGRGPLDRSIIIGIACTLLFHLLLILFSPQFAFTKFTGVHSGINVARSRPGKTFDFELAQPAPKLRDPFKFVETNSAAPENIPDKTENFSNRNQQSAQEVAAKEKDLENRPSIEGQDKIKNDTAIVSGNLAPPQLPSAPSRDPSKDEAADRAEQLARAEQALEGDPNSKNAQGGLVAVQQTSQAQPKERPRLASVSLNRTTPLTTRLSGVANVGIVGRDARWSEYGEYLNEMLEIIQVTWYRILEESRVSPPRGSHVVVTFKINAKGETDIVKVEDADSGKQGVFSCQNAITYPQPYRKWSQQMIAVLGEQQELTIAFYYQ